MAANWAYLDLPTGVAGDMLLAALLDLGVPQRVIDEPLAALGLQSCYRLNSAVAAPLVCVVSTER